MKWICTTGLLLFITATTVAQNSHLIFFNENNLPFLVELNGTIQAEQTATRVKIKYYNQSGGNVKIIFDDKSIQPITSSLKFRTGMIAYFIIKKKGDKYIIEWNRELPYTNTNDTDENHLHINYMQPIGKRVEKPLTGKEYLALYKGKKGCEEPMTYQTLRLYQTRVSEKPMDKWRLKTATALLDGNCFSISQVKSVVKMFEYDDIKADYVIAVYPFVFNQDDFKEVLHYIRNKEKKERIKSALDIE